MKGWQPILRERRPRFARQGGTVVHVIVTDDPDRSVCGRAVHGPEYPARLVPADERCGDSRCAARWPAALRVVS